MSTPIVVERHMQASPERVYRHLTSAAGWNSSLGGSTSFETQPGGLFHMAMPDGNAARGQVVELVENQRVVFTWGWVDNQDIPPGSTKVTIELTATDTGTMVRLTHEGLDPAAIAEHTMGWEHFVTGISGLAEDDR